MCLCLSEIPPAYGGNFTAQRSQFYSDQLQTRAETCKSLLITDMSICTISKATLCSFSTFAPRETLSNLERKVFT